MDASSAAAATSSAAPAPSNGASAPAQSPISAPNVTQKSAPAASAAPVTPTKPKLPWGDGPLRVPINFNGKEDLAEYTTLEELQRDLSRSRLANTAGQQRKEALQRAEAAQQQWEAHQARLKADPFAAMREMGIDPTEHVARLIQENARREQMSPEERIADERRRAEEPWKQKATQAERQLQQMQEQQRAAALEQWADREYTEKLEPAFKAALQAKNVEADEDTLQEIANEASTWLEAGVTLDPAQIVDAVVARQEKGFWGRLGKQTVATLSKRLSPTQKQELMALWVQEFKQRSNPAAKPGEVVPPPPAAKPQKREYIDEAELRRRLNGR